MMVGLRHLLGWVVSAFRSREGLILRESDLGSAAHLRPRGRSDGARLPKGMIGKHRRSRRWQSKSQCSDIPGEFCHAAKSQFSPLDVSSLRISCVWLTCCQSPPRDLPAGMITSNARGAPTDFHGVANEAVRSIVHAESHLEIRQWRPMEA